MSHRTAGRAVVAAIIAATVLLMSACSDQQAGSAATLGDTRISEQQLADRVSEILTAQGQPADSADANLTKQTLGRMIIVDLVDVLSARNGVVITQGQIDEQVLNYIAQAGDDRAAFEQSFVTQGVAPSTIEDVIKLNLQAQALGVALDPSGSAEQQGQALFDAVSALSVELGVQVSPRFGTWDPATLQVGEVPVDLASPPTPVS